MKQTAKVIPRYTSTMKTAISLPDELFARVETSAQKLGLNRSQFFATAAEHYLASLEHRDASAEIDAALALLEPAPHSSASTSANLARLAELTEGDDWVDEDDR